MLRQPIYSVRSVSNRNWASLSGSAILALPNVLRVDLLLDLARLPSLVWYYLGLEYRK
jgi:hypothetical protein